MLSEAVSTFLEVIGLILICVAAFMVAVPVGLVVSGVVLVAVGTFGGRS